MKGRNGFTLIILLLAMCIIAILAAISYRSLYSPIPSAESVNQGIDAIERAEDVQKATQERDASYGQYLE